MHRRRALLHTARLWTFPVAELFQAGPRASVPLRCDTDTLLHVYVRTQGREAERERERDSPCERGRHARREKLRCVPAACRYLPLSSSSTKSRWCHAAMLSATPPDEKEERLRDRERQGVSETAVERRRGRGRRGGECLCLAVMAYSQGRSYRTKAPYLFETSFPSKGNIYIFLSVDRQPTY